MSTKYELPDEKAISSVQVTGAGTAVPERGHSNLKQETGFMERERRLEEQQGHRYHLQVQVKEAREYVEENAAPEGEPQNDISGHPEFENRQDLDGADPPVDSLPAMNTDARREYENQRREQEMEKQLRLENQLQNTNQPRFSSAPRPRGP